jgi:hypothetical protein
MSHFQQKQVPDKLLLEWTFTSSEDDPLFVMSTEANATYDKTNKARQLENSSRDSSRHHKKKPSKGRKHRGKQEIQPINRHPNANESVFNTHDIVVSKNWVQISGSDQMFKLPMHTVDYTKKEREEFKDAPNEDLVYKNLITGSLETESVSQQFNTSVENYKSYLNNSQFKQDSNRDIDGLFSYSVAWKNGQKIFGVKHKKVDQHSDSLSPSDLSLLSESTSSNGFMGWSYQQTRDGKLTHMSKDFEWRQLYNSRYVNERVEAELVEFKEEIEKKFTESKCRKYRFPRKQKINQKTKHTNFEDQTWNQNFKSQWEVDKSNQALFTKQIAFDYKSRPGKEGNRINKTNIDFSKSKEDSKEPPKRLTLMKTFDEDNKHQLSKSMPRTTNNSKSRKSKHKRQSTIFKFDKENNSWDREKILFKTISNWSVNSHSSMLDNILSKSNINKIINETTRSSTHQKNVHKKFLSQIKFHKSKKLNEKMNIKKMCKNLKINSGVNKSTINSTHNGQNIVELNNLQSATSSKQPSVKRKSKHSRWISKNSGRGSRGNSQGKKLRKEKNLTFDFNSLAQSTHQNINKSHNLSTNQISSNKASRYNQLIGSCNPTMLYQTQQWIGSKNKSSGPTSPKDTNKVQILSNKYLINKNTNDPVWAFNFTKWGKLTSNKKLKKKKPKSSAKRSTSKNKASSASRSLSKYG